MHMNLNKQKDNRSSNYLVSDYLTKLLFSKERLNGKVDSIFEHGFNLIIQGQLLYVGTGADNLSAFGVVVPNHLLQDMKNTIEIGQQVKIQAASIGDDQLTMTWTLYSRPNPVQICMERVAIVGTKLPKLSVADFIEADIFTALAQADIWQESGFSSNNDLAGRYRDLLEEWDNKVAQSLIGAGIGLTPSGDDFLQGYIMMTLITGRDDYLVMPAIQLGLEQRSTTLVSETYYKVLFAGHLNYSWSHFFDAVLANDINLVHGVIKQIQQYGATSGNDILLGVQVFLEEYLKAN